MALFKRRRKENNDEIKLENLNIPNHIGIIMDGNGRWAKRRGMPRTYGHKAGVDNLIELSKYANSIGVKYMTVYAFSTENWSRPKDEVSYLMYLLDSTFNRLIDTIEKDNIKMKIIGEKDKLSDQLLDVIKRMEEKTKNCTGMTLFIAFNYGSRQEIVHACKEIVNEGKEISIDEIQNHLYTKDGGDVDLLIRTSGEQRISNFMLWQISYSEIYITDTYWPDFNGDCLNKVILEYNKRDRRFGGLKK